VAFFVWSTALRKILAMDNLKKRHVIVVDWCYMCKRSEESVDFFFHCEVANALWSAIFNHVGLSPQSIAVWKMMPLCLLWCLWEGKTPQSFEGRERTVVEIKSIFFNTLYFWTTALDYPNLLSFHDFLDLVSF
jgi:hypothetical protein